MKALHNIESLRGSGEETFVSLKSVCQSGGRARDLRHSKQAALTTAPPPPSLYLASESGDIIKNITDDFNLRGGSNA